MKVKALCTIKDANGWHVPGEIFETEEDLGNLVEAVTEAAEKTAESAETEEAPKPKTRRKKTAE